jgi:hypothetical protein
MSHRELPVIQFVCVLPRPCSPRAVTMPVASQSLRASLTQCSRRLPQPCTLSSISSVRFASQGAPHYNEPSGWLFGEKVTPYIHPIRLFLSNWYQLYYSCSRLRQAKRGRGKTGRWSGTSGCLDRWLWEPSSTISNQIRGKVSLVILFRHSLAHGFFIAIPAACACVCVYFSLSSVGAQSIQTWALAEAKKRMEARGEPTDYVPSE